MILQQQTQGWPSTQATVNQNPKDIELYLGESSNTSWTHAQFLCSYHILYDI